MSIAASISAMVLAGPRVYFAMARDGVFLASASRGASAPPDADAGDRRPGRLESISGAGRERWRSWSTTPGLRSCCSPAVAVLAVFVLRHREPNAHRPFKALGYPLAPAFFVIVSLAMVAYQIWSAPVPSLWGLAVIAAGFPLYFLFKRSSPEAAGLAVDLLQLHAFGDRLAGRHVQGAGVGQVALGPKFEFMGPASSSRWPVRPSNSSTVPTSAPSM